MTFTRRILPVGIALTLALAACGGSDSEESSDTAASTDAAPATTDDVFTETSEETAETEPAATEPAETTPATEPAATEPPATEPAETTPATDAPTDGDIGVPAEAIETSLVEWAIEAPTEYAAGEVTFVATNNGNFPHELVVIQGEGYESLPLAEGGAVNEDELPTGALLGRTERIGGGSTTELTVTLAPGNYVLVCNLGGGDNSHAGRGQRLDITVS